MKRSVFWTILIVSALWALFPDLIGPIDELLAMMVAVVDILVFVSTKAKVAKDAVAILASDSPTQSN